MHVVRVHGHDVPDHLAATRKLPGADVAARGRLPADLGAAAATRSLAALATQHQTVEVEEVGGRGRRATRRRRPPLLAAVAAARLRMAAALSWGRSMGGRFSSRVALGGE